jgi:MFS family permease
MRGIVQLLRRDHQARRFFLAYCQSALGTGAGYVALLLVAYQRFHSPWAIALILLADFVPPMFLAPVFGALVDRTSRRRCAIAADVVRAGAFVGLALIPSFAVTVVLALAAGSATALSKPALLAGLPEVVERSRLSQATALFGGLTELGYTLGPGIAALTFLITGPKALLFADAATFAISGLLLSTLTFGAARARTAESLERPSLLREARDGLASLARMPATRTAIVATSTILLFGGMVNVAELLLARKLGAGSTGFSLFVAVSGAGIAVGSMAGASGGELPELVRRFLLGIVLVGAGLLGTAGSPTFAVALFCLAVLGFGNGLVIVYERLIIQATVNDELMGRVFGAQAALDGAAFAGSYLVAGVILALVGPRVLFLIGGVGAVLVWLVARIVFARTRLAQAQQPAVAVPTEAGAAEQTAIAALEAHR